MIRGRRLCWTALGLVGCASGAAAPPAASVPASGDLACAKPRGAVALGFSLGSALAGVPPRPADIERFIEQRAPGGAPLAVEMAAAPRKTGTAGDAFNYASVAGPAVCPAADIGLRVAGDPPQLWVMAPPAAARQRVALAAARMAAGQNAEARSDLAAARAIEPGWAQPLLLAGDTYRAEGRWDEAQRMYGGAAAGFPWMASAHARLGAALLEAGRRDDALRELRLALALRPHDIEAAQALRDAGGTWVPPLPPPAERVATKQGVVWIAHAGRAGGAAQTASLLPSLLAEATAYARCKEAFRASEALRRDAAGLAGTTWVWSVAEEDLCTVLWLAAYLRHRGVIRAPDARLDDLVRAVEAGFVSERSLHDVGARAHPHAPLLLPPARRARQLDFVTRHRSPDGPPSFWLAAFR